MSRAKRSRWWAVGALALVGLALAIVGGPPVVNNSLAVWFVEGDPALVAYERFQERYGNDEVVVVAVRTGGEAATGEQMDRVQRVAQRMRAVDGIASVLSPADVPAGPMRDLLVSGGDVTLLLARFDLMADADARRHDVLVELRAAAEELEQAGDEVHWAGIGLVYDELNEASFRETPALTGASFVLVGLVLWYVTASVGSVVLTLGVVVVSILILMGLFAALGEQLNMVTAILPTLVLVVGTTNAVHIFRRVSAGIDDSVDDALRKVFWPCWFTALTTAAGFASLATARMAVIRELGVYAAIGVLVTLLVSFTASWAALSTGWFRPKAARGQHAARAFAWLGGLVTRRPGGVLAGAAAFAVVAFVLATRVVADTYSIEFFRADHPVRVDSDAIERGFGWYLPLEFEVATGREHGALDPATLDAVAEWQQRVEDAGLAQWSLSLADFAGEASETAPSEPPDGLTADEASALRVTFGVPMSSARGWAERIERIRDEAERVLPSQNELGTGGYLPLYVRMMDYIVDTQVRSFTVAFVLVFLVMGLFLRSGRMIAGAFLPNLLPLAGTFGVMGALGVRLDIATVTIAAIALGIVVDDTVHLLHHFREALRRTGDPERAVQQALRDVGPALFSTTLILTVSFSVLGFASVLSIALFGLLTALTLVLALVADVVVMPAVLVLTTRPRAPDVEAPAAEELT
jgi:predicted RND superfamily exporter protein